MSSSIFFRFKSQKDNLQITFDGTSLSVFEVKRDIITLSRLGDGTDFDLEIYSGDNNEKYDDDTTQIPRSSTVIARRLPASKPGAGKAARYVTGKMPVNARNAHRIESAAAAASRNAGSAMNGGKEMTEEEKLQAMLNANDQTWKAEQQAASHKPVVRSYNKQASVPDKPPPDNYRCYRCCEKGHWIQACPTNNDPTFDNLPRVKRTTGIPRSSLKVIDDVPRREDGTVDVTQLPPGAMLTATGEWVTSEADKASWARFQEQQNAAAEKAKESATDNKELRDRGLECSIHKGIFVEPTKTPCCGKTYCHDCIENALLDADLLCPNCGKQVLLDALEPDDEMASKMKAYEEEKKAERKEKEAGKIPTAAGTPQAQSPNIVDATSPAANGVPGVKVSSAASTPNGRKRSADGELPNDRRPSNPAVAMTKTNSNQGTPAPNQSKSNTPQPPKAPAADVAAFNKQLEQMQQMATSMASMQNGNPAMMNPMMGFNPAMMGMNMGMNPMMGMPNTNMQNMHMQNMGMQNMQGFNGMPNMNMNGWGNQQMMGNQGWQGGNMNTNGNGRGGTQNGYGRGGMQGNQSDGPYMRPPVNQYRQCGRMNRPRSQDYRPVGGGS